MKIPDNFQAVAIGFSRSPHLKSLSKDVFFGDWSALRRSDEIHNGVLWLSAGPDLTKDQRAVLRRISSDSGVPFYDDSAQQLEGRLKYFAGQRNGSPAATTQPAKDQHGAVVICGAMLPDDEKRNLTGQGILVLDRVIKTTDIPRDAAVLAIHATPGSGDAIYNNISRMFASSSIPLRRFMDRDGMYGVIREFKPEVEAGPVAQDEPPPQTVEPEPTDQATGLVPPARGQLTALVRQFLDPAQSANDQADEVFAKVLQAGIKTTRDSVYQALYALHRKEKPGPNRASTGSQPVQPEESFEVESSLEEQILALMIKFDAFADDFRLKLVAVVEKMRTPNSQVVAILARAQTLEQQLTQAIADRDKAVARLQRIVDAAKD